MELLFFQSQEIVNKEKHLESLLCEALFPELKDAYKFPLFCFLHVLEMLLNQESENFWLVNCMSLQHKYKNSFLDIYGLRQILSEKYLISHIAIFLNHLKCIEVL